MQKNKPKIVFVFPTLLSRAPVAQAAGAYLAFSRSLFIGLVVFGWSSFGFANPIKTEITTPEDVILSKGFSAYMDGKDKQALSYFEEVVRLNPKNDAARKGLEKVKVRLKRQEADERAKALKLAEAKVKEGKKLFETNDAVGAVDSLHTALDAAPDYKPAQKLLKSIKEQMNKEVGRRKMNLSMWSYSRGVLAYLDRDWAKAYRIWSERNRVEPNNVALTNATKRAEQKFQAMMISEREDFFRRGGRAFYSQGLYREAKNAWDQVLILRPDDYEALEAKARAEDGILRAEGKNRDSRVHDLLEQALDYYANQSWKKSLDMFIQIAQLDPEFSTAKEYITKLNQKLNAVGYTPSSSTGRIESWRRTQASNESDSVVDVPDKFENYVQARKELESQLKRDPTNIRIQQELDKVIKRQDEESERIYKDGLIAYSQGNRTQAIQFWKQVLVINPEHKKAAAALNKARAEEERSDQGGGQ